MNTAIHFQAHASRMLKQGCTKYQQVAYGHTLQECCQTLLGCMTWQWTYQLSIHFRDGLGGLFWSGELHKAHASADASAGVP